MYKFSFAMGCLSGRYWGRWSWTRPAVLGLVLSMVAPAFARWVVPEQWELSINRPYGLAVDAAGNAYVSADGSSLVVRVTPEGQVATWGSTGEKPMGVVVDATGQVYVVNYGSDSITRITAQGSSSEWASTGRHPTAIALGPDRRTVYVTNSRSDTVTRVAPDGRATTLGTTGRMPAGIAVDAQGNVYTADYQSSTVTKITPQGQSRVLGKTGLQPFGLALDAQGNVYTADHGSSTVTKITPQGQSITWAKTGLHPWGIVVARDGTVYTSDYAGHTITRIGPDGRAQLWGPTGPQPLGIALDKQERVIAVSHAGPWLTRLNVVDAPAAPQKLRASWTGAGQAELRWEPPSSEDAANAADYLVEQRTAGTGQWRPIEADMSAATVQVIAGLPEDRSHEFRVSAKSWVGLGRSSEVVILPARGARMAFPPVQDNAPPKPRPVAAPMPSAKTCASWLGSVIRPGASNVPEDVNRLIGFLNVHEGEPLLMDGSYDEDDIQAVKRFQLKYRAEILAPWGLAHPTGLVLRTTLDKINALQCGKR